MQIALQCRKYWADYDLELIIGENYQELGRQELAAKYYNSASLMCPSRFLKTDCQHSMIKTPHCQFEVLCLSRKYPQLNVVHAIIFSDRQHSIISPVLVNFYLIVSVGS